MKELVVYIHGQGGNAGEAEHYAPLFPDCDVTGFDYKAETPWNAKVEFARYFDAVCADRGAVSIIANSIGAYYAMLALSDRRIAGAYFISPVVDMVKLIANMMADANVTEEELRGKKTILTASGAVLSWEYLRYARSNPVVWRVPTHILYGENDILTSVGTVTAFAERTGASLDIMKGGEHWFHTVGQMEYLDGWIKRSLRK